LLHLRGVLVPALQKRQRLLVGFVFEIVDRVADHAAIDAGFLVGFEEIFDGQRRGAAPTPVLGQFGRIDMGVPGR
jgi:hypothetical protein